MKVLTRLVEDNLIVLQQGVDLLDALDARVYAREGRFIARSSVGGHFRHCIDFYTAFLDGVALGRIDYTARERDPRVERDSRRARARLAGIALRLAALAGAADATLAVRSEDQDPEREPIWSPSSLGRELQVVSSHTVHHFAMIAVLLRLEGVEPPEDFGVAPSTLAYWRSLACAR